MTSLNLTSDELQSLAKLVYLGEWVMNAFRDEPEPASSAIAQQVYSRASEAGLEEKIERLDGTGEYAPSMEFDLEMLPHIEEYNDEVFWEELIDRLSLRDMLTRHTMEELASMSLEQRLTIRQPFASRYEVMFERLGLDCLRVEEPPPLKIQLN